MSWSWNNDRLEKSNLVYSSKAEYTSLFLSVFALCYGESNKVIHTAIKPLDNQFLYVFSANWKNFYLLQKKQILDSISVLMGLTKTNIK